MVKKPAYYKMTLKSRRDIVDFLMSVGGHSSSRKSALFAFNVKCHNLDLSFDHLLHVHKESGYGNDICYSNTEYLAACREKWQEYEDCLFDWGIEGARRLFTDSDCFNQLWDGSDVRVKYEFWGRSGGWLVLTEFERIKLTGYETHEHWENVLLEMNFNDLRKLYQLVLMLQHDTKNPSHEVEHHAAFDLFENICNDLPRPDTIQKEIPFPAISG